VTANTAGPAGRRVVVGIGTGGQSGSTIAAAITIAKALGAALECNVIEKDELIAVASLPVARSVGRGGGAMPITPERLAAHFERVREGLERELLARCAAAGIRWNVERPRGDFGEALLAAAARGDIVIVERDEIWGAFGSTAVMRRLLEKALAVVLPASRPRATRGIMALSAGDDDGAASLAAELARALSLRFGRLTPLEWQSSLSHPDILVLSQSLLDELGGLGALRSHAGAATTLILTRDGDRSGEES
jgi:hypothetical protein